MALNDIFTMIKADKYTQDGREELIKAQQAETEDKTYKPGEISETTGKQKQPDGSWKFPKQAGGKNAPAQKKTDPKSGSGMSKHWVQKGDEADFVERTPEEEKKMWQGVASRQSDDKLRLAIKNREGKDLNPVEKIKLETAKEELARRNASKPAELSNKTGLKPGTLEEMKKEDDETEARKNHEIFMEEYKNREFQELFGDAIKFDEYGLPSKETIQLKNNFLKKEGVSDPNKLTNSKFNALAQKLDKRFGINNIELSQELLVAKEDDVPETRNASKPAAGSGSTPSANQSELLAKKRQWDAEGGPANEAERAEYDKLRSQIVYKLPDEKSSFSTDVNRMKKLKEQDPREFSVQLEKLHSKYNTNKWNDLYRKISQDAAPRVLTGDCKIRIRK